MKKGFKNSISIFSLVVLAVALSACSHNVLVAPAPPQQINAPKSPLNVGLYITDQFKNFQISESRKGDTWIYPNLGQASADQLQLALQKVFSSVEVVSSKPPVKSNKDITIHAVIEPAIEKFDFNIPMTKFQVYPATITYKITVYDKVGKIILTKTIAGVGDTKGSPGFDFAANPARSASKAVTEGVKNAVEVIANSNEVKKLRR
jgi:hypothetical protein